MSDENTMGTVATQAPPPVEAVEEASGRSSRAMLLVGGVAVVVLAVFAYVLFGMGGGEPESTGTVPKPVAPAAPTDTDTGTSTDTTKTDSKSGETKSADVEGRNPFEPLVVEETDTGTETGTTGGTTTAPTTPAGETVTVALVTVGSSSVTAKVDSKTYKGVGEGETFATNFQVYAIFNDECAGFLYGDDSFALCEGKSVSLTKLTG